MKRPHIFILSFFLLILFQSEINAQKNTVESTETNRSLIAEAIGDDAPKLRDRIEKRGMFLSLWIPGIWLKTAGLFVPKDEEPEARELLMHISSVRLLVREGLLPNKRFNRKFARINKRMQRKKFENLIKVKSDDDNITVDIKTDKKDRVRQAVIMVESEGTFVLLKTRGKIDIQKLINLVEEEI